MFRCCISIGYPRGLNKASFTLSLSFFFFCHSLENKLPKVKFGWFPFHLSDGYSIYSLFIGFKYMECEKLISLRLTFRF